MRNFVLILSSAVLLILSFPSFNQPWCSWVALVPWFLALRTMRPRAAFGWSYLVGLIFFLASMWWLIHVTLVGLIVLCAYLAFYFGFFGWLASTATSVSGLKLRVSGLLSIPSLWVVLEYLRSHLLSGLGWNLLGYSQTSWLPLIQIADLTGVWGVSFLIVWVNVVVAHAIRNPQHEPEPVGGCLGPPPAASVLKQFARSGSQLRAEALASGLTTPTCSHSRLVGGTVVLMLLVLGYGWWRLAHVSHGATVRVAVVQGNISVTEKWDERFQRSILERYERLTRTAVVSEPDLIVWPETAVPGIIGVDRVILQDLQHLAVSVQTPLLVGIPILVTPNHSWTLTNSALFVDPRDGVRGRYDKIHLVPFGEFIPFESAFPKLRDLLPPIGNFVPGQDYTVLTLPAMRSVEFGMRSVHSALRTPHSALPFSVLICFEDIFPDVARRFVRRGARMLLNITNDAWFGPTAAAYQHAQASTFRAVELRVPVIRAANTGWSGCIDAVGRWTASVHDDRGGELFVTGVQTCDTALGSAASLYSWFGDWFIVLCCLGMALRSVVRLRLEE